jgi:sugar/nucleoside kinase (ribokinase family)
VIREWRDWARPVHTVKGNEEEVRWFLGEGESAFAGKLSEGAARILDQGVRVVLVTRGTEGFVFFSGERGSVREASFSAVPGLPGRALDTTGCGDAFSSGYLLGLLRGESPLESALLGNALAGLVSRCRGLQALRDLADPVGLRDRAYQAERSRIRAGWEGDPP